MGQSVSIETGLRIIREGTLIADYAGTRRYDHEGCSYFIPEAVWKKSELEVTPPKAKGPVVSFIEQTGSMHIENAMGVTIMQRGIVIIAMTDEVLAREHGWTRVPEPQTETERLAGLIRVAK